MHRRDFITLIGGAAAWPLAASPAISQTSRVYRLGTLLPGPPITSTAGPGAILFNALAKRGYTLGQNLIHEARGASGKVDLVPQLMQELKAANVDVVVTISYPAAAAAKRSGIPTVLASGSGDPVATGLVESLARPGGNVTGITDDASTLSTKRLSLLTSMLPKLRRVAMLWNKDDLGMSMRYEASAKAAHAAPMGQMLIYQTEDGRLKVEARLDNETLWLTQQQIAALFQTTVPNINIHLKNILEEGELTEQATIKDFLIVRQEGSRSVQRHITHYNLDAILSVGYRVKSAVATRFRIWATHRLH